MIPGTNTTDSYMHYQRHITAKDTTLYVSPAQSSSESKSDNADYKVSLSNEKNKIEQEYSGKKAMLKQEHETKIKQLETQYKREQSQIEQAYIMKKQTLKLNMYA